MFPALSLAVALALGVGAADSNVIVVKIDGKETRVTLAGINAGSERGTAFAQCLVAGRILRVSGSHSAATVTMLDDSAVSAHIAEFLGTQTSSDPCALGKAAYQPKAPRAVAAAPLPVVTKKKPVREVHVSFAGGSMSADSVKMPAPTPQPTAPYRPPAPPAQPSNQPTYANPPTAQTYKPPTTQASAPQPAGTTSGLAQTGAQQSLQQQPTEQMQQQKTETIPTTTYSPPPA
jgi:hypothetical protein